MAKGSNAIHILGYLTSTSYTNREGYFQNFDQQVIVAKIQHKAKGKNSHQGQKGWEVTP